MKISDQQYSLILDYISGELEEQSRIDVEFWINSSDKNKRAYQKVLKKILYTQWSLKDACINQDLELKKFERRLSAKTRFLSYVAVAASVLILISISVSILWDKPQFDQEQMLAQSTVIKPGERGAELILSTGEIIDIDAKQSQIKERDGSIIQVDSVYGVGYQSISTNTSEQIYNTLRTARGREYNVTLSDGTKVWLNAESELRYPVQFTGDTRQVYLKGEGYFEVKANKEKPFLVNSGEHQVKVYGTQFCVNTYDEAQIQTVLVEGSIGLKTSLKSEESLLKPGQLACANLKSGDLVIKDVNVHPYVAWKDGDFVFEDENLESIMKRLGRWYDVKVFFMNPETKSYHFTGDMKRYSKIEDLLYFMEETSDAKFEIKKGAIIIMKK
jgi:ferric-dicitrate binding protein FerR (iron transport regulator)